MVEDLGADGLKTDTTRITEIIMIFIILKRDTIKDPETMGMENRSTIGAMKPGSVIAGVIIAIAVVMEETRVLPERSKRRIIHLR